MLATPRVPLASISSTTLGKPSTAEVINPASQRAMIAHGFSSWPWKVTFAASPACAAASARALRSGPSPMKCR
ncbi:MAG: hypothetical protein IPP62_04140 [bacterium]|nr:hypothetical protein [bacterium]